MNKIIVLRCISGALIVASLIIVIAFWKNGQTGPAKYDDGIERIDPNTIALKDSGVRVSFSDVILTQPQETRKLVVFEQTGTVSYKIEDRMFDFLDWEPSKKYQSVQYEGKGSFVVNLDKLGRSNIMDDQDNKVLTIKIPHPKLDTIEIDPNKVKIDTQKNGFLALGDIKLTLQDYNKIESELTKRLKEKFDNSANGQKADDLALKAVTETFEPIVKAVDGEYTLKVEFVE